MSLRSQRNLKLVGAASAAALAIGAAASAPALAAAGSSASVSYTCNTSFGPVHPSAAYKVKPAPAKMAVGQPLKTTSTFTLDTNATVIAETLGWAKFSGTIKTKPSAKQAGLNLKFPKTTLGNGATPGTTDAQGKGVTLTGIKTGKFTFKLGDLGDVVLKGFDSSGNPGNPSSVEFPTKGSNSKCTNDAGTTTLKSGTTPVTVKVVKDTTKTAEKAKYAAKKHTVAGTAKVRSHFGSKVTGKVRFTLMRGTHKVASKTGKLNKKGSAKATFKHVTKKGNYALVAKYLGSKTLKGSSAGQPFVV